MEKNTPEIYHQKMSTAFHTMIALPLAAFVYLFLEKKHNDLSPMVFGVWTDVINYGFTLCAITLTIFAYKRFAKGLGAISPEENLKTRMGRYTDIAIQAYLIIGLAFLFLVMGLLLTTTAVFIVAYVILLFLLSLHRPTPTKYIKDLGLQGSDKEIVKNKGAFLD